MRMLVYAICALATLASFGVAKVPVGYRTLKEEVVDAPTKVTGKIPEWLSGHCIRQQCGSLGDLETMVPGTYIDSFFDCIPAISQFKIYGDQQKVTFDNRYPDTMITKVWKDFNMNMTASGIFFPTAFAKYDPLRVKDYPGIRRFPAATFWQIGKDFVAHGENTDADLIDMMTLKTSRYPWKDEHLGYPKQVTFFLHNPAHDHKDETSTWSTTSVAQLNPKTMMLTVKQAVYKIVDGKREVFSEYTYGTADLKTCSGGMLADLEVRPGYMHDFLMTDNYIILPVTSYLIDPCALFVYRKPLPLFSNAYHYYENSTSKVLIMRKSDGKWMEPIHTEPFFATHVLNAYERKGYIYADFLTFPTADIYTKITWMDSLFKEVPWEARAERFVIETNDFTLLKRKLLAPPNMLEFSNINPRFEGKSYTYSYIANRPSFSNGSVWKLNVMTGELIEYKAPEGCILQEPNFVEMPGAENEDDGVLLVHGLDTKTEKAYVSILCARRMIELARATADHHALFGIHSKYFPFQK